MTSSGPSNNRLADPIKLLCWTGAGAYIVCKIVRLSTGAALFEVFDFSNPSLAGLAFGGCILGLILRSPKIRHSATLIETHETRTVVLSFLFVFILMAAYYTLREVRDGIAPEWSPFELANLWTIQFVVSTIVVALYGLACSRIRFRFLVPAVYIFFACTFGAFFLGANIVTDRILLDKIFYIWVTLFGLFHLSVFWSFMADLFTQEQSKRLFAFIAAGASAGAAAGPLMVAIVARDIGTDNLMLIASLVLLTAIPLIFYLQRLKIIDLHNESVQADLSGAIIGGRWWAGFRDFFTNPYLLTIAAFILLYTSMSTWIYFELNEMLGEFEERADRTTILATRDAIVNILTFGLGLFITGRLVTRMGMPSTLALIPIVACFGFLVVASAPILIVMLTVDIVRRAGNYGVTRPCREMLFTTIDRESRFKAKPVVDVVVYRGGDALWGNAFAFLSEGLGIAFSWMAIVGAGLAAIWAASGAYLGRAFNRREQETSSETTTAADQRETAT